MYNEKVVICSNGQAGLADAYVLKHVLENHGAKDVKIYKEETFAEWRQRNPVAKETTKPATEANTKE